MGICLLGDHHHTHHRTHHRLSEVKEDGRKIEGGFDCRREHEREAHVEVKVRAHSLWEGCENGTYQSLVRHEEVGRLLGENSHGVVGLLEGSDRQGLRMTLGDFCRSEEDFYTVGEICLVGGSCYSRGEGSYRNRGEDFYRTLEDFF